MARALLETKYVGQRRRDSKKPLSILFGFGFVSLV